MAFLPLHFKKPMTRRRFLKTGLLAVAGIAVYAGEVERHWLDVTHSTVELEHLPAAFDGMRIVQLSDLHLDEYTEPSFLREVVRKVNELKPDAVMLTGDYVSCLPRSYAFARGAAWSCAEILDGLACRRRFGVLGNHDCAVGPRTVTAALTAHGVEMLNDRAVALEESGQRLWIAGMVDPGSVHPHPELAVPAALLHEETALLLCHSPDYADQFCRLPQSRAVGLMLSGHTHGGQVVLPLVGPLALPNLGKKYVHGLFRIGAMQLYVNRGVGAVGLPFRFNCPPEIAELTLRAKVADPAMRSGNSMAAAHAGLG